jgi:hypothetical protein
VWWNTDVVMVLKLVIISDKLRALKYYTTGILRVHNFPVNFSEELPVNSSRHATSNLDYPVHFYFKSGQ